MNKWDSYFLSLCNTISSNSKCLSRQLGAVLVRDRSIIATGYNGPPRNTKHCAERVRLDLNLIEELKKHNVSNADTRICPRRILQYESGQGLHMCIATHAEANCIANAAKNGVCTNDTTLFLNWVLPCKNCAALIINAGIKEIVCVEGTYDKLSSQLVKEAGVAVRYYVD